MADPPWMVLVLVAAGGCGDRGDGSPAGDASMQTNAAGEADGGEVSLCDAPADPLPLCSVAAGGDGVSVETDRRVVFHDACGQVLCETDGGDGTVVGPAGEGVLVSIQGFDAVLTYGGLEPGDRVVPNYPVIDFTEPDRAIRIEFPPVEGAVSYSFAPGDQCNSFAGAASPITVPVGDMCRGADGRFALLGHARGEDQTTLAYAWLRDIELASGDPTTVTLEAWTSASTSHTVSIDGIPDDVGTAVAMAAPVVDGRVYPCPFGCSGHLEGVVGSAQFELVMPADPGDGVFLRTHLENETGQEQGLDILTQVVDAPLPAATALVLPGDFLPHATLVSWTPDESRPRLEWSTNGSPGAADVLVVATDPVANGPRWYLILPPDTPPAIDLPALPASLAPDLPVERELEAVLYFESSAVDGYRDALSQVHALSYPLPPLWPFAPGFRHRIAALGDYDPIEE